MQIFNQKIAPEVTNGVAATEQRGDHFPRVRVDLATFGSAAGLHFAADFGQRNHNRGAVVHLNTLRNLAGSASVRIRGAPLVVWPWLGSVTKILMYARIAVKPHATHDEHQDKRAR
ncbi:MAG: hypothetical protein ING33_04805 [Rhodocyclaceae bacterium]|nr:hypothetical protein [Rhodocyclaceae bacterium]